jgi:hypothetical protein
VSRRRAYELINLALMRSIGGYEALDPGLQATRATPNLFTTSSSILSRSFPVPYTTHEWFEV